MTYEVGKKYHLAHRGVGIYVGPHPEGGFVFHVGGKVLTREAETYPEIREPRKLEVDLLITSMHNESSER